MMSHYKFLSQPDNPQMVRFNSMQTCSLAAFNTKPKFRVWGCQACQKGYEQTYTCTTLIKAWSEVNIGH